MTIDYAQTLREVRDEMAKWANHAYQTRMTRAEDPDAAIEDRGDCRMRVAWLRAIDAALCALRIVKPELGWCEGCGKRYMLDIDFCDTEVCAECAAALRCPECDHDLEDGNCDNCDEGRV